MSRHSNFGKGDVIDPAFPVPLFRDTLPYDLFEGLFGIPFTNTNGFKCAGKATCVKILHIYSCDFIDNNILPLFTFTALQRNFLSSLPCQAITQLLPFV